MKTEVHHVELINGITDQLKPVLEKSPQAIYIYLDDNHKVCNKKFADLLGYQSPEAWGKVETPLDDVLEKDQQSVIESYVNASEKLMASEIAISFKNIKTGKSVKAKIIVAPIAYAGHIFTIHFISKI